jgi:hypothetical protein
VESGPQGRFLSEVIKNKPELEILLASSEMRGTKVYPNMLHQALQSGRVGDFKAICDRDAYLSGYEEGNEVSIKILGPVPSDSEQPGMYKFKVLGDDGVTKNGHSIVLKLKYKNISLLLGGDLNAEAEHYLLEHYTGISPLTIDSAEKAELIRRGREIFESDVAKACHHGSHKFLDVFLQCINPLATIISSGDNESHSHPRPDTLGAIGKNSRGSRPLIFSTELARSAKEGIKQPERLVKVINDLENKIRVEADPVHKAELQALLRAEYFKLERSIAIYGMINVRSDGEKIIIAQKLEKPSNGRKYDIYKLEYLDGELKYQGYQYA